MTNLLPGLAVGARRMCVFARRTQKKTFLWLGAGKSLMPTARPAHARAHARPPPPSLARFTCNVSTDIHNADRTCPCRRAGAPDRFQRARAACGRDAAATLGRARLWPGGQPGRARQSRVDDKDGLPVALSRAHQAR
jgi:hypothetical protein